MIRDITPMDLPTVLALNNAAVPHVNLLSLADLTRIAEGTAYFRAAVTDRTLLGFLAAFLPGAAYESENYRWFETRYDDFVYIDRIVVAPEASGKGVARRLYNDLESAMRDRVEAMTCEVNIRPPNPGSVEMHRRFGFREVGQQETGGGAKRVSLLRKTIR
jgi:predicted GNAT superfamily acetyltransferase